MSTGSSCLWPAQSDITTAVFALIGVLAVLTVSATGQQKIDSRGDHNTNINGSIVVAPQVTIKIRNVLKAQAKRSYGDANQWQGLLVAANDKVPPGACEEISRTLLEHFPAEVQQRIGKTKAEDLRVLAGSNEFICRQTSCNIIRSENKELLWIERDKRPGVLKINATVLAPDGVILTSIERNQFFVNRNRTYRLPVRDKSSLQVFGERGGTVVRVHFANRNTLVVEGLFNDGNGNLLNVQPDGTTAVRQGVVDGVIWREDCDLDGGGTGPFGLPPFHLGGAPIFK